MANFKNAFIAGIAFALLFGIYLALTYGVEIALITGPISGILFGGAMYLFSASKKVNKQTQLAIDEKDILFSGPANHFLNREGVGGKMYLLQDKIVFKSHSFNIQNHEQSIAMNEIADVLFFNTLGIVPNGLKIVLTNNKTEKFVVNNWKQWKEEIFKLKNGI